MCPRAKLLYVAVTLLGISSCREQGRNTPDLTSAYFDHSDLESVELRGEEVETPAAVGLPTQLLLAGDRIWVVDAARDPTLHAMTRQGGLLVSLGRKGEGPGDIAGSPRNLQRLPSDAAGVWVFDAQLRRLTRFEARHLTGDEIKTIRLNSPVALSRAFWVGEDKIVGMSFGSDTARFAFFDSHGKSVGTRHGPLLGTPDIPREQRLRASNAGFQVCIRPDGRGFALLYFVAGRIEMYDANAVLTGVMDVPYPSEALFEKNSETNEIVFRNPRQWYKSCGATGNRLYALFSGRLDAVYGPDAAGAEFVHVFDWDGALRDIYRLDRPITAITVDSAGTAVYGMSHLSPVLVRFQLPSRVRR